MPDRSRRGTVALRGSGRVVPRRLRRNRRAESSFSDEVDASENRAACYPRSRPPGDQFADAKRTLKSAGLTHRWVPAQTSEGSAERWLVCDQKPAAGAQRAEIVALALAQDCPLDVPDLEGKTYQAARRLLDSKAIGYQLLDGVDIDFQAALDAAPPTWIVCAGSLDYAVEDALAYLSGGDSASGILYDGEGDIIFVELYVAPKETKCFSYNEA